MHLFSSSQFISGQAISRTVYEARGTIFELRMTSLRVSKGTLCTTLVAAMISSAGSLREVQAGRGTCDGEVDRPNMQTTQDAHHFPVVNRSPLTSILCRRLPINSAS